MTDRELLEAAAKAAGYRVATRWEFEGLNVDVGGGATIVKWNPLRNDGDALRLAVKMGLPVLTIHDVTTPACWSSAPQFDPYAATRRAIVRAAGLEA